MKEQKNKNLSIIFNGALNGKTAKELHKELLKATIIPDKRILGMSYKIANKCVKIKDEKRLLIDVLAFSNVMDKVINGELRNAENKGKERIINNMLHSKEKVFFVASRHDDSAKDHKNWQGKIYVNEGALQDAEIKAYCKQHNILTIQWVMDAPVYFVTRPNCRHYFVPYTFNDIKSHNYTIPTRKIGNRDYATTRVKNKQYADFYMDRINLLTELQKTPDVKIKLDKSTILYKKYAKVL